MYSNEDIKRANDRSIISYLEQNGYELGQKGRNSICLAEHDSLIITPSENKWYWFSKQIGGVGCLDFVKKYEGLDFKSAMDKIIGNGSRYSSFNKQDSKVIKKEKEFILPPKVDDTSKIYHYLCDIRKIKRELVDRMIADEKLYQDNRNNCVFVGYDMAGVPKYALRVGTNPNYKFKGEVEGSNKAFAPSPRYNPKSDNVAVFESVIDALSYESMMVAEPSNTIALSGVSFSKLSQYLKDNPQTKHIVMMLDNDEVGISTSKKMADHCALLGYNVMLGLPRKHKDWNDELVAKVKEDEKQSIMEQIRIKRDKGFEINIENRKHIDFGIGI